MLNRCPHYPSAQSDDWEDQPAQGGFHQWGLGVALPLFILTCGIRAIVFQHAAYGARIPMDLSGVNAIAFGIAEISAALFLHCHYFWGNVFNQAWFAVLGKIISAMGFIAGLGTLIVRVGVLGIQ